MLKKVLISLGVVIVVTGLMIGGLLILKQIQQQPDSDNNGQQPAVVDDKKTVADLSKDYGACTILDVSFIKSTLGEIANNLRGPNNMGVVGEKSVGEGVETIVQDAQACGFPFVAGGEIENGFNVPNGLTVQVTVYENSEQAGALSQQISGSGIAEGIDGLGDSAFYTYSDDERGLGAPTNTFKLQVFKANRLFVLTLRQPADVATFDSITAKEALVKLAEKIN